ncbi:IclR family transcriptional regulator [Methylobacterium frigidaeris]
MEMSKLPRSTVYNLLDTLESLRWIQRSGDGYVIGVRLFELGSAYVRQDGLQSAFRAIASEFVTTHNEVVQLGVLDKREVVYVAREDPVRAIRLVSDIGSRLPVHCSALGKALLASLTDSEIIELLPDQLETMTEHSITRRDDLIHCLNSVRKSGLAYDREESTLGLACFASFIGVTPLEKRLAVSTSVPISRLDDQCRHELKTEICEIAVRIRRLISARL